MNHYLSKFRSITLRDYKKTVCNSSHGASSRPGRKAGHSTVYVYNMLYSLKH